MFVVRLGSFIFQIGFGKRDVFSNEVMEALDLIEGKMMSNFEQLQTVIGDLSNAVDAQGLVVTNVDEKLNELEAAAAQGQEVTPLIAQLRTQVDELKGNTDRLSTAITDAPTTPDGGSPAGETPNTQDEGTPETPESTAPTEDEISES